MDETIPEIKEDNIIPSDSLIAAMPPIKELKYKQHKVIGKIIESGSSIELSIQQQIARRDSEEVIHTICDATQEKKKPLDAFLDFFMSPPIIELLL